jgi:hypothetical protein
MSRQCRGQCVLSDRFALVPHACAVSEYLKPKLAEVAILWASIASAAVALSHATRATCRSRSKAENVNAGLLKLTSGTDFVFVMDADHHPIVGHATLAILTMEQKGYDVLQGACLLLASFSCVRLCAQPPASEGLSCTRAHNECDTALV